MRQQVDKRRTFAIISHPDAGKTTLTEKLLLHGGAIALAGTVKGRKSARMATSDWMKMEQQRGISVTTSVMQFHYQDKVINLLDTPGHADFSEDTYRTLTAVDSALMVLDAAKGVEPMTIKLMEVCRLRATPIWTFVNKVDRDIKDPLELIDEIESVLNIECAPINWPIGSGKGFKGVYDLYQDLVILYEHGHGEHMHEFKTIAGLDNPVLDEVLQEDADMLREQVELVRGASHKFDIDKYLQGKQTPVYFGTALSNFGVDHMLSGFAQHAPAPLARATHQREVSPYEQDFSGFVFKIQANMDPQHRDRIAFLRVCSGVYHQGMKLHQSRLNKKVQISHALTFLAGDRENVDTAYAGDIIGLHNHGTIQIGDTFTAGENLKFIGIPNFAPEIFRRVVLKDPLKMKALQKGLVQLSEEGATQIFRPLASNDLILGAVGILQFDVVKQRLKDEYNVDCDYDNINVNCARWLDSEDAKILEELERKAYDYLALDGANHLTYLAPTKVNLQLAQERFPQVHFYATREH